MSELHPPTHDTLDAIGLRHGTDKCSAHHDYLRNYQRILAMRDAPIRRLLEIGVYDGGSLRMWGDFLPGSEIIGVDVDPRCLAFATDRLRVEIADQSNPYDLARLAALGPFDVVVDDGSHIWSHQILTFETLFPALAPGGAYILEDIDTSFGRFLGDYGRDSTVTAAQYVTGLATHVLAGGAEPNTGLDLRARSFVDQIDAIVWIRRSAVILRK